MGIGSFSNTIHETNTSNSDNPHKNGKYFTIDKFELGEKSPKIPPWTVRILNSSDATYEARLQIATPVYNETLFDQGYSMSAGEEIIVELNEPKYYSVYVETPEKTHTVAVGEGWNTCNKQGTVIEIRPTGRINSYSDTTTMACKNETELNIQTPEEDWTN